LFGVWSVERAFSRRSRISSWRKPVRNLVSSALTGVQSITLLACSTGFPSFACRILIDGKALGISSKFLRIDRGADVVEIKTTNQSSARAARDTEPTQDEEKGRIEVIFETIDDDELLVLLAAVGRPSVLGTINGELTVISTAKPASKSKGQ